MFQQFGPPEVFASVRLPLPSPRPDEVRIRVRATTVTRAETDMRRGRPLWGRLLIGLWKPRRPFRVLGTELAGEIDAVGARVTRFRVGDRVFGFAGFRIGANAERMCLPESASLVSMPAGVSYAEAAAAVDGPTTAQFFLETKARLTTGQSVLVIGASGSVGTNAVQLAKRLGAVVTGVCSAANVDLVKRLGADLVVDYTREDFRSRPERYDVVFDTVGKSSFAQCRAVMKPTALYLDPTFQLSSVIRSLVPRFLSRQRVVLGMSVEKKAALHEVRGLLEAGALEVVVDGCFPIERIVEAHQRVDTGHKVGNVVVVMDAAARMEPALAPRGEDGSVS